jgi:hypothetical protein
VWFLTLVVIKSNLDAFALSIVESDFFWGGEIGDMQRGKNMAVKIFLKFA